MGGISKIWVGKVQTKRPPEVQGWPLDHQNVFCVSASEKKQGLVADETAESAVLALKSRKNMIFDQNRDFTPYYRRPFDFPGRATPTPPDQIGHPTPETTLDSFSDRKNVPVAIF